MNKKLEIGEVEPRFDGWDSVSLPEFNIILSELPYEDGSLNEVYWSHVLEHIPYCNIESVVTGIYNKLETGGKFRTVCPDMRKIVEAYMNDDTSQFDRGRNHWGSLSLRGIYPKLGVGGMMMSQFIGSEKVDDLVKQECYLASVKGEVYGVVSHVAAWDFKMFKNLLHLVGFSRVEQTEVEPIDRHQQNGQLCVNAYK